MVQNVFISLTSRRHRVQLRCNRAGRDALILWHKRRIMTANALGSILSTCLPSTASLKVRAAGTLLPPLSKSMATVKDSIPHVERTATDQRQSSMVHATIGRIEQVNSRIRLLRLYLDHDQVRKSLKLGILLALLGVSTDQHSQL